ncbi:PREDICTED: menin-like [Priapulus caudatus]|uniref:Menin n=1 Tax=Priapulus caudatus TaxID=37621 RepID=A0ABM1DUY3_PRICU|nr:PREDICTED: menin-like [Priapulus caudatus]
MRTAFVLTKMAGFREHEKRFFPIKNGKSAVNLFKYELTECQEPNLVLLSIVAGAIENILTSNRFLTPEIGSRRLEHGFPTPLELISVETLYTRFEHLVKSNVDLSKHTGKFATRELLKRVSDVIWQSLTRSYYKDKAHLQSLHSFLTGNKLDCFGVAFAVVAACQLLELRDVHLALSEDHAWVVYGKDLENSAEVTLHGKGYEDKRGQPITSELAYKSWLYVNGHPVVCTRQMEVAALVSAVNPHINATTDSYDLGCLQQELLWMMYDLGHLTRYPLALGNLGDLNEIQPDFSRPSSISLFNEAIEADQLYYSNQHVYPYTYLAGYCYRHHQFKEALKNWAAAADVIRKHHQFKAKPLIETGQQLADVIRTDKAIQRGCGADKLESTFVTKVMAFPKVPDFSMQFVSWRFSGVFSDLLGAVDDGGTEDFLDSLATRLAADNNGGDVNPNIAALAAACGEAILNPDYLLGSGDGAAPFTDAAAPDLLDFLSNSKGAANGGHFVGLSVDSMLEAESPPQSTGTSRPASELSSHSSCNGGGGSTRTPQVVLRSHKMWGMKELLTAPGKLNASAISLQLTAQSQVDVPRKAKSSKEFDYSMLGSSRKRAKRD